MLKRSKRSPRFMPIASMLTMRIAANSPSNTWNALSTHSRNKATTQKKYCRYSWWTPAKDSENCCTLYFFLLVYAILGVLHLLINDLYIITSQLNLLCLIVREFFQKAFFKQNFISYSSENRFGKIGEIMKIILWWLEQVKRRAIYVNHSRLL